LNDGWSRFRLVSSPRLLRGSSIWLSMVPLPGCRDRCRSVTGSSSFDFDLAQKAQRITFFFPEGKRIVLLTTFRKQRQNERVEVARARQAMARCVAEGHTVEGETE
jgi:hypothetical protein